MSTSLVIIHSIPEKLNTTNMQTLRFQIKMYVTFHELIVTGRGHKLSSLKQYIFYINKDKIRIM